MALEFLEFLNIPPLPIDTPTASALGRHFAKKIDDCGGTENLVGKIAAGILHRKADDPPTALSRLNGLFAQVYTRQELESLARNTLAALALGE